MAEHVEYTAVDVNRACTGAGGKYVALLYPGSDMPGLSRSNQVDITSEDEIPDLLEVINEDAPFLAAVSVARICTKRVHADPAASTQYSGKQIELVSNDVYIPDQIINLGIQWSTAVRNRDAEGFSTAKTLGGHAIELRNLLFMPDAKLDPMQRYGKMIRARGSNGLYVALGGHINIHQPS